jgi:phage terminase large subunit
MARELQINHTAVFSKNLDEYENSKRFIVNQGGSRSSKTYSIIQLLIFLCLTNPKLQVSVVRKSFPSLRGSVLRDFVEIMNELELYSLKNHNKTEQRYIFDNGASIEFFSIDDSQKVRGRKRDVCYLNEANELTFEDFQQLSLRTSKTLFIDFNPSDSEHWLYDLLKDDRSVLIKSNYKDNIYLSDEIVTEIENLINVDENYYKIYALGERPTSTSRIYTHFKQYVDEIDDTDFCYGLDFGFNHPCSLIKTSFNGNRVYVKEEIYQSKMTTNDLISQMNILGIDKSKNIYCDSARPEVIEEIRRAGYSRAQLSNKSVKEGIDRVKSMEIYIHIESTNLWREYKLYSWKSNGDLIIDEPIKLNDDGMDAMRYAIHTHIKKRFNPNATRIFIA